MTLAYRVVNLQSNYYLEVYNQIVHFNSLFIPHVAATVINQQNCCISFLKGGEKLT